MAPEYKLTYFNTRGLAEATRFLFKYGGIDFEDNRITKEEWPQLKDSLYFWLSVFCFIIWNVIEAYFGKIPTLEYKGRIVGQSLSIARYVGKLINLAGKDDWENLEIDAIVDTIDEIRQSKFFLYIFCTQFQPFVEFMPLFSETDPERKKALSDTFYNETLPFYLTRLDAIVERNNGYLALNRVSGKMS